MMSTVTVVDLTRLPLVPLTVMVWFPVEVFLEALMVIVELPDPVMEVGLKVMVSPFPHQASHPASSSASAPAPSPAPEPPPQPSPWLPAQQPQPTASKSLEPAIKPDIFRGFNGTA
jgi:hypothetical protein